ncbi:ubiquitin-like protein Pup [Alloscardovia criceti]|uniref:ubiquitin-like protein Pup n=1 Tax=Alloscardovia criceti TaxID=356828 RepID=UPI00036551A9|nr:ubiquitin-like protein Pup [Alloscardovia criceti]
MPNNNQGSAQTGQQYTSDFFAQQQAVESQQVSEDTQLLDAVADMDSVLDDIESTLEENAEEYVSSFVQKGGQ